MLHELCIRQRRGSPLTDWVNVFEKVDEQRTYGVDPQTPTNGKSDLQV